MIGTLVTPSLLRGNRPVRLYFFIRYGILAPACKIGEAESGNFEDHWRLWQRQGQDCYGMFGGRGDAQSWDWFEFVDFARLHLQSVILMNKVALRILLVSTH